MSLCPKSLAFRGRRQGRQPLIYIYIYTSTCALGRPLLGSMSCPSWAHSAAGNVARKNSRKFHQEMFAWPHSCERHVCECHLLTVFCSGLVSDTSGFEEQISHSEQPFWSRATWTWFYSKTMCKRILAMTFVDKIDAWGSEEKKHGPEHWLTRLFLKLHRPIDDIVIKSRSPGTKHQKKHV